MMEKWMSRDDQKHVSGDGLHFYQDPREELKWMRLRMTLVCQVFIMVLVQGT